MAGTGECDYFVNGVKNSVRANQVFLVNRKSRLAYAMPSGSRASIHSAFFSGKNSACRPRNSGKGKIKFSIFDKCPSAAALVCVMSFRWIREKHGSRMAQQP